MGFFILKKRGKCMQNIWNVVMNFLFGGSVTLLGLYSLVVGIDIITGYMKGLSEHNWRSALNIQGLAVKFVSYMAVISAAVIDQLAVLIGVALPVNVAFWACFFLIMYEIGSILENLGQLGVNVGFVKKYLGVLRDSTEIKQDDK